MAIHMGHLARNLPKIRFATAEQLAAVLLRVVFADDQHAIDDASNETSPTRLGPRDGAIGLEQKPKAADLSDPRTVCSGTKTSRQIDKQSIPLQNLRCNGDPTTAQSASKDPNGQKRVCVRPPYRRSPTESPRPSRRSTTAAL
jgi:hypothetical protein